MRPLLQIRALYVIAALFAGSAMTGCNGSTPSALTPAISSAPNASHHGGPLTTVSTIVGIKNDWIATVVGSGSAPCWGISPSLPAVKPGDLSAPVTLSYTPLCPTPGTLLITYGPGPASTNSCTFNVSYNGTRFNYTVTQGTDTTCTATPSADTHYDEILTYDQILPSAKHIKVVRSAKAAPQSHSVQSHKMNPNDAYDDVVTYAESIGFPNAQHYGNDGTGNPVGMTFGAYNGTNNQPYLAVQNYAHGVGFPDAQLYGNDGSGHSVGLYYQ